VAALTRNTTLIKAAVTNLDKALRSDNLTKEQRGEFLSLRGMCHFNLRNRAGAREDFDESIRLDPDNDVLYENRARFWEAIGRDDLAGNDRSKARAIRKRMLESARDSH
jgi:lipoprotein NlpI